MSTDVRRCRICGCTDEQACWPPCSWAEADLCTGCREVVDQVVDQVSDALVDALTEEISSAITRLAGEWLDVDQVVAQINEQEHQAQARRYWLNDFVSPPMPSTLAAYERLYTGRAQAAVEGRLHGGECP